MSGNELIIVLKLINYLISVNYKIAKYIPTF